AQAIAADSSESPKANSPWQAEPDGLNSRRHDASIHRALHQILYCRPDCGVSDHSLPRWRHGRSVRLRPGWRITQFASAGFVSYFRNFVTSAGAFSPGASTVE